MFHPAVLLALFSVFMLGLRHGVDYDHVAAITDIAGVQQQPKRGMLLGFMYAIGHATVILLLGGAAVVFGVHLPQGLDIWMERIVGVTLLVLGIYVVRALVKTSGNDDARLPSRGMMYASAFHWLRSKLFKRSYTADHSDILSGRHGVRSAFTIGVIHGIGAETPTQLLFFILAAGIGGTGNGVTAIFVFVAGLIVSNTVICALSVGVFGATAARKPLYRIVAGATAVYSVCVGLIFIFGASSLLPGV